MNELRTTWSGLILASMITLLSCISHAGTTVASKIILSRSTMNFGTVVIGSTTQVVENIWNPTSSSVSVQAASIEGSDFQFHNAGFPVTLGPRQQVAVTIIFSPASAGKSSGSLLISLDGTTPYVTVPLYGTGANAGQLTANPPNINFAAGGTGQRIAETVTNVGATNIFLQTATANGSGFAIAGPALPLLLKPNQTATFSVYLPAASAGNASGSIAFSGMIRWWSSGQRGTYQYATTTPARTSLIVPVSGTAAVSGQLTPAPSTVNFGTVQVGNTQTASAALTNSGTGPVTISQASATGTGFSFSGLPLPLTLSPGGSVTFSASFSPQSAGTAQGNIAVISNASNSTVNLALSGAASAPAQLTLSPANLNFGTVPVGKTQQLTATLVASGSNILVSSASVSSAEFSLGGMQLPISIPAGQSSSFTVSFTPQASGTVSASIAFGGNAPPAVEALSGAGSSPPLQHSVSLSWSPSGSSVAGYNVYRGSQTGGPYAKLTPNPAAVPSYGDGAVSSGQTYFYVTTAVDSAGAESTHSNEVQAVIPTP